MDFGRCQAGEICLGTVDAWLLWDLDRWRCMPVTSPTPRGRNFSTYKRCGGIPNCWRSSTFRWPLPEVRLSSAFYGEMASLPGIPAGLPIGALIGDSPPPLYGHAGFSPAIKATHGTGSSLMTPTATRIFSQKVSLQHRLGLPADDLRALEGNIIVTGAAIQWLADLLGLVDPKTSRRWLPRLLTPAASILSRRWQVWVRQYWNDSARADQRSGAQHNRGS